MIEQIVIIFLLAFMGSLCVPIAIVLLSAVGLFEPLPTPPEKEKG